MSPTVLVVDDEPGIRRVLVSFLRASSYDTREAGSGEEALTQFTARTPDLVLLDLGLPDMDGLEVLRQMRMVADVPTVLVTARAEETDKIVGLSVGADDYVTKPFSPREVVARVAAVLRRTAPSAPRSPGGADSPLRFAGLVVDPRRREVKVTTSTDSPSIRVDPRRREVNLDGEEVQLSALEFDLLLALAREPGRVFSRAQLLEKVWGANFYGDERVVDVHIRALRRKLRDSVDDPRVIATVRSVGYKFVAAPEGRS